MTHSHRPWLGLFALAFFGQDAAASDTLRFTVGGGSQGGVYVAAARAICSVTRQFAEHDGDVTCSPIETRGSRENITRLLDGEFDVAIVQSDVLLDSFKHEKNGENLRRVADLHKEEVYLVSGPSRRVQGWGDLAGKRINVGPPGSGQRATSMLLLDAMNYDRDSIDMMGTRAVEQLGLLCAQQVDALVVVLGRGAPLVKVAAERCGAELLSMEPDRAETLLAAHPAFVPTVVPEGAYPNTHMPVDTVALQAVLVSRADVPAAHIRALVEAIEEGGGEVRGAHAALRGVRVKQTRREGPVPLHDGALEAYTAED